MERVKGIEPSSKAWEAFVLPLNYTRAPRRASHFLALGIEHRWRAGKQCASAVRPGRTAGAQ
jgi:hypothetical protein